METSMAQNKKTKINKTVDEEVKTFIYEIRNNNKIQRHQIQYGLDGYIFNLFVGPCSRLIGRLGQINR